MALSEDLRKRAEEKCAKNYPCLKVQDAAVKTEDGKVFVLVYVLDNKQQGLWLEV